MSDTTGPVAVIGGGISGLVAAHELARANVPVDLFEATDHLGGRIATTAVAGITIPTGPDNFLVRRPEMLDLVSELGLASTLTVPAAGQARIHRDGHLRPIPPSLLGIPVDLDALARTGLLTAAGIERARCDLDAPDDHPPGDESVGSLVRRRLGDEVLEYLVDPLLGGINAGDSDRLSVEAGAPQIAAARQRGPSLIEGARWVRSSSIDPAAPVFSSVAGGLGVVVDALQDDLVARGVHIHLRSPVDRLERGPARKWRVTDRDFDHVIVAAPASPGAGVLTTVAPAAAGLLRTIDYSSVAVVILVLAPSSLPLEPELSGVLVPRAEGFHVTAISVASNKWPHLGPDGRQVLRVSVGRRDDTRWLALDDTELVRLVGDEVGRILDGAVDPIGCHVARWMDSLPQYDVGHADLVDRLEASIASEAPGVVLAGAALRGLGLPACVASGRHAAAQVLAVEG